MHLYSATRALDYHLENIKGLDAVAGQKLADIPRNTWAMSATRGNTVWNQVTSYMSESTNSYIGAEVSSSMCLRTFVGGAAMVYQLLVPSCCKFGTRPTIHDIVLGCVVPGKPQPPRGVFPLLEASIAELCSLLIAHPHVAYRGVWLNSSPLRFYAFTTHSQLTRPSTSSKSTSQCRPKRIITCDVSWSPYAK